LLLSPSYYVRGNPSREQAAFTKKETSIKKEEVVIKQEAAFSPGDEKAASCLITTS